MDAATAAGAAASGLATALEKAGKDKGTSAATLKVVTAAKTSSCPVSMTPLSSAAT